jgi:signal transduction histidine kinase
VDLLNESLRWVQNLGFVAVAVWALVRWSRQRDEATRWLAATFGVLGLVVTVSAVLDGLPESAATEAVGRLLIAVLVLFPYLLLRFVDSFEPVASTLRRTVGVVVLLLAVSGLLLERPAAGDPRTPLFQAFALLVAASWVVVLPLVAWRFWRAGRRQPTVARRRLRMLAAGAVALSLAILLAGVVASPDALVTLATRVFALGAALLFLLGFLPPPFLRRLWRAPEEDELHAAALGLMAAADEETVAATLIPHLRTVVAARGVALVRDGELLGAEGLTPREESLAVLAQPPGALTSPLRDGAIHVWIDSFTPFFGDDELALFERVGVLADLALDRASLLATERESRAALELANAELETFVYSASHDLKSPLISMLGYVDLLLEEHRDQLGEEGRWYLDRLATNGRYMEALIRDLLELSRVGRMQTHTDRVEAAALVADVVHELQGRHPGARIELGALPVLELNPSRARQLFTNLLENAAEHGSHDGGGVHVTVTTERDVEEPGDAVIAVRDDGPGVPAPYRELVFGLFERLAADRAGTGIGLAICRKIMESVGGRIWLADRDDGAEIRLLFPPSVVVAQATTSTEEVPA